MAAWNVSIRKTADGLYDVHLSIPGALGGKYHFNRKLPPDFGDFVADQRCDHPMRKWRRPPGGVKHDELLFCAGDIETLKEIGARLYDALFRFDFEGQPKDLTDTFLAARAGVPSSNQGLGFALDLSAAPELARVPWEALYLADRREELLLGIDIRTNVVRHLESYSDSGLPPGAQHPIRMLVAVANTSSELAAGAEMANIEQRLESLPRQHERFTIETLDRATKTDLHRLIVRWKPHILHFIGHGGFDDEKGVIYLHRSKESRDPVAVNSTALRDLVRNNPPWLVVLNSCSSGTAARASPFAGAAQEIIRANVPFVVAMQAPISDEAAIRFSEDFYEALANDDAVATAVSRGREAILGLGDESLQPELVTPVLYTNGRADRIEILDRKPEGRASPSFWGKIDPANPRVVGIATLVSAIVGILALFWMAQPAGETSRGAMESETANMVASDMVAPAPAPDAGDAYAGNFEDYAGNYAEADNAMSEDLGLRERQLASAEQAAISRAEAVAGRYRFAPSAASPPPAPESAPAPPPLREPRLLGGPASAQAPAGPAPVARAASAYPARLSPPPAAAAQPVSPALRSWPRRRMGMRGGPLSAPPPAAAPLPRGHVETSAAAAYPALTGSTRDEVVTYQNELDADPVRQLNQRSVFSNPELVLDAAAGALIGPEVVATFAAGTALARAIDIRSRAVILSLPAGEQMAIELVGRADPGEARLVDDLGLARAETVAEDLRGYGIADERIIVASAGARWAAADLPEDRFEGERRVDARLVLRDADRLRFAFGSAEIAADHAPLLERLTSFALENPDFGLELEGHAERSEPDVFNLSRRRAERVQEALRLRGVDEGRLQVRAYSDSRPEAVGPPGPDANRRVQIVLVPEP